MRCESCEHFKKFYIYSKKYGFMYINQGMCNNGFELTEEHCYDYEEGSEATKQDNFYVETNLVEMLEKCEEIIKQLNVLIKLYKPNKKINPPPKKEKVNPILKIR